VAIIMDGNGRWAKQRGLPRLEGHRAGTQNIRRVIRSFANQGVQYLTLYAFSSENWSRPHQEVRGLWRILGQVIVRETRELHREGVRLKQVGRKDRLAPALQKAMSDAEDLTRNNDRITLCVALDYGGRPEIVEAVRRAVSAGLSADDITEESLAAYLDTAGLPDPDLVVRTGGEMRLSNFLIWQTAYSEYYSTPACWPDFDDVEIATALEAYRQRQRRFGGLGSRTPS
jgi:undecaprenyl diphosphate synthase